MKSVFLTSLLALFFNCVQAADLSRITRLAEEYLPSAHVGIWIQNADTKEVLYTLNPEQGFTPASVVKSFNVAAAFLTMDPDFTYQTTLSSDDENIVFTFTGDPSLKTRDIENLLSTLSDQVIQGDFIIDNTYFEKPYGARGIVAEDLNWYFLSPAKSVIIDENYMPISITPAKTIGDKVHISISREDIKASIINEVITETAAHANTLCQLNVELLNNNSIHLYGCWPYHPEQKTTSLKLALPNPELLLKDLITKQFSKQHTILKGKIKIGAAKADHVIASHQSPALTAMTAKIMQESNNIYADSLAKTLGKQHYQRGTLQAGSYAITQILKDKISLYRATFRLYDGSGASTYNQVTPKSIAILYQAMYPHPHYMTSMQVNNTHTFRHRIPENMVNDLYIKTGSMTGVSNVTGYIKTNTGKTLIVVCLLNELPLDKSKARQFERELITLLGRF